MLPRLSLPFSNKVKHYIAIALHTIKRQPYGSCQLPITYKTISSHTITFITSCLYHITSQHALQKQVRRPLLCCCMFYVAATGLSKNRSYLRIKTTTIFRQVCCFNLQGPAVVKLNSTKVRETDTRQPPLCKTSCMFVGGTGLMCVDM